MIMKKLILTCLRVMILMSLSLYSSISFAAGDTEVEVTFTQGSSTSEPSNLPKSNFEDKMDSLIKKISQIFPKTGEAANLFGLLLGILLVFLGSILLYKKYLKMKL